LEGPAILTRIATPRKRKPDLISTPRSLPTIVNAVAATAANRLTDNSNKTFHIGLDPVKALWVLLARLVFSFFSSFSSAFCTAAILIHHSSMTLIRINQPGAIPDSPWCTSFPYYTSSGA
jgi:hypothetical protein